MKNIKKILFIILFTPSIVYADEYLVCGNKTFPFVFSNIFSTLFNLIRILVPILFVITGIIAFIKASISSKAEEGLNKAKEKLIRNTIAAIIIFFIMSIINFVVLLVAGTNNTFMNCMDCLLHSDNCERIEVSGKLCSGLLSDQDKYDENCNLIKPLGNTNYGSGDPGVVDPVPGYSSPTGEWASWKQFDSRWGSIPINGSSTTISDAGCLITSVSIQIARSGTTLTVSDFNPGVFSKHASYDGIGLNWNSWFSVAPNFKLINDFYFYGSKQEKADKVKSYIDQGKYVIVAVNNEGHWVAVDRVEGDKIYMFDPGDSHANEVFARYGAKDTYRFLVFENEG